MGIHLNPTNRIRELSQYNFNLPQRRQLRRFPHEVYIPPQECFAIARFSFVLLSFVCHFFHFLFHRISRSQYAKIAKMPWLSRRNSSQDAMNSNGTQSSAISGSAVTFVPGMMDGSCGTSPVHYRNTLMRIMLDDMKVMAQNMHCLPDMVMSMWSMEFGKDMFMTWMDIRDCGLQMMLLTVELWGMMCAIPMIMYLPGMISMPMCALIACCIAVLSMPSNGDQMMRSSMPSGRSSDEFPDERWICINGSMTR